ncbi:MAG: RDD family protein [Planctomycetota bacterium]
MELRRFQPNSLATAGPLLRSLAWLVDGSLIFVPVLVISVALSDGPSAMLGVAIAASICLAVAFIQATWGTTPGKKLFQIRIVDQHGLTPSKPALAMRSVFQFLWAWSLAFSPLFGILSPVSFLVLLFTFAETIYLLLPTQRSIHDRILKTQVVLDAG